MPRQLFNGDAYQTYREESLGACELACELGLEIGRGDIPMFWPAGSVHIDAIDVHHIFSPGGTRPHRWSNLIAIARRPHDLFHSGSARQAWSWLRMACLLAKCRKRDRLGDPDEFALAEIDECAGCSVLGWAESFRHDEPRIAALAFELVDRLKALSR